MAPRDPAAGSDSVRPGAHARGARVRRSRLLAQTGVPLLLLAALLIVVINDARPDPSPVGRTSGTLTLDAEGAARAQLAELEAWAARHPDDALTLYERARALSASRVPEVSAAAARMAEAALARVDPELRATLEHGERLLAEGRDWEADRHYVAALSRPGLSAEAARVLRDARGRAAGRLQARFTADAARVRELVAAGAHDEAEALAAEVRRYAGPDAEQALRPLLSGAAAPAAVAASPAAEEHVPVDPALLGRALACQVEDAGQGAVRLRWTFDREDELEDWPAATQSFSGALLPAHLEALEPADRPGWYVAEGALVGDGWTRRALGVDFRPDRPVEVELAVRGARNRVASLGLLPGRSFLGGSAWALDLPLERVPRRTRALEALVARCRERGPVVALAREARFLELEELVTRPEAPRVEARVALALAPAAQGHALALRVDDLELAPVAVELDEGPVRAFLVALGSPVVIDEVAVTGVVSADIARALPELARSEPDDLPGALRRWLARRRPEVRIR